MAIKKFSEFIKIYEGSYPSYWDDEDDYYDNNECEPESPTKSYPFKVIGRSKYSFSCLVKSIPDDKLYFYVGEGLDASELAEYGCPAKKRDREGDWVDDYSNWDPTDEELASYINYNYNEFDYGEGLEDFEGTEGNFFLIDEPLKKHMIDEWGFKDF
jgi:hypothetical protein